MKNSKKWYKSRLFWIGMLEIAGGVSAKYFAGASNEVLATSIIAGVITALLRFDTTEKLEL